MPASVVIELRAQNKSSLLNSNGLILHAAWFKGWAALDENTADSLHQENQQVKPFTISPLIGLHADSNGVIHFNAGQAAWFRVTTLSDELTIHLHEWLNSLNDHSIVQMVESRWNVEKISTHSDEHLWAGQISYEALLQVVQSQLSKRRWTLEFATPMTINGNDFVYPFPSPESLVRSWLNRWQAFAPWILPDELPEQAREHLAILNYHLSTETVRMRGKKWPGCVGKITFQDMGLSPEMRQTLEVLMQFSFFCGSGYKTTQGLGQTRLLN